VKGENRHRVVATGINFIFTRSVLENIFC